MTTKICSMCEKELDTSNFSKNRNKKDGLNYHCRACQKQYRKSHYQNNRDKYIEKVRARQKDVNDWFKEFKKTLKCNRCPENHPACLSFHHKDRSEKEYLVSQLARNGMKETLLKEIEKCEVLCQNCHAKEHFSEFYDM